MTVKQPATRIVCFGDSLVEGEGDTANKGGWVGRLASVLPPHADDSGYRIFNLGIGGASSVEMLMRFGEVIVRKPDILIMGHGANDVYVQSADETPSHVAERRISSLDAQEAWTDLLAMATRLCPRVLIMTSFYKTPDRVAFHTLPYSLSDHAEFMAGSAKENGVEFLNLMDVFKGQSDFLDKRAHPNAKGYDLMFTDIHNKLKQLKWID